MKIVGYTDTSYTERINRVSSYVVGKYIEQLTSNKDIDVKLYRWDMDAVPNVSGRTFEKALESINSRGFVGKVKYVINQDSDLDCTVKETDPKAATLLERGSTVTIKIYRWVDRSSDFKNMSTGQYIDEDLEPCPGE